MAAISARLPCSTTLTRGSAQAILAPSGALRPSCPPQPCRTVMSVGSVPRWGSDSGQTQLPALHRIQAPLPRPEVPADVDRDLWELLELCSNEELEEIYHILYGSSPLSPVVKSLVVDREPPAVHIRGKAGLMRMIEQRFRFLAANAGATLQGRRPSYRECLISVRNRLKVDCPSTVSTPELEQEIYLHLMQTFTEATGSSKQAVNAAANAYSVRDTDSINSELPRKRAFGGPAWARGLEQLAAPLKLGASDLVPVITSFSSALGMSEVRNAAMRNMGMSLVKQRLQYEAAFFAACEGAANTPAARQAALRASQKGLTTAAAQYGAMRGMLSILGPLMWGLFFAEIGLKSIGTDYGRIVRAIYTLSQVRMVRTYGWAAAEDQ